MRGVRGRSGGVSDGSGGVSDRSGDVSSESDAVCTESDDASSVGTGLVVTPSPPPRSDNVTFGRAAIASDADEQVDLSVHTGPWRQWTIDSLLLLVSCSSRGAASISRL